MAGTVGLVEYANGLAIVTIDRPKALNAADVKMVVELRDALTVCKTSDSIKAVLLQGAGEKGFCSGGDVKGCHAALVADSNATTPKEQMYQEYNAIFELSQLSKPTVAIAHGITMGLGFTLSTSARYTVATEKSRFAMPENNIGLFPDAGFAHLSANTLPKGLGRLLALTGVHLLGAGDVIAAGLASHFVPVEKLPTLYDTLKDADLATDADAAIKAVLSGVGEAPPEPKLLLEGGGDLPSKFGDAKNLAEVYALLDAEAKLNPWAAQLLPLLQKGSPFSQATAFKLLELAEIDAAAGVPEPGRLAQALERDFAAACRIMYRPDFVEGLRAVLVDKDNAPKWQPTEIAAIGAEEVDAVVAALPASERKLGLSSL